MHRYYALPGTRSLKGKDGKERPPPGITDALGEEVVLHLVGDLQLFVIDGVESPHQLASFFVVKVLALPTDVLVRLSKEDACLPPAVAPLLAPCNAPLAAV
jgi:hypothetical protein